MVQYIAVGCLELTVGFRGVGVIPSLMDYYYADQQLLRYTAVVVEAVSQQQVVNMNSTQRQSIGSAPFARYFSRLTLWSFRCSFSVRTEN